MAMVSAAHVGAGRSVPAGRALSPHVSPSATPYVQRGVPGPSAGILGRSVLSRGRQGWAGRGQCQASTERSARAHPQHRHRPCGRERGMSERWGRRTRRGQGNEESGVPEEAGVGWKERKREEKGGKCLRMN